MTTGRSPLQAGSQFHVVPQSAHTLFSRRCLYPKAAIVATLLLSIPKKISPDLFSRKRKTSVSPFSAQLSCAAPTALLCPQALHVCRPRSICGRSVARRPRRFLRPSHKQKMRARSIAPRTRSKKRRLLAQEKHT